MSILKISNPKPIPSPRLPTCFSPGDCFLHSTTSTIINHPQLGFIIRHIHIYIYPHIHICIYIYGIYTILGIPQDGPSAEQRHQLQRRLGRALPLPAVAFSAAPLPAPAPAERGRPRCSAGELRIGRCPGAVAFSAAWEKGGKTRWWDASESAISVGSNIFGGAIFLMKDHDG